MNEKTQVGHFDEGEMIILDQTLEVCKVLSKFDNVSLIKCIESGGWLNQNDIRGVWHTMKCKGARMSRVKKNTCDLEIGSYFYRSRSQFDLEMRFEIIAQGNDVYGWENNLGDSALSMHENVWVEMPKTKLSQFLVGDKFKLPKSSNPRTYEVTAIGEKSLLAKIRNGDEYPFSFEEEVEEV